VKRGSFFDLIFLMGFLLTFSIGIYVNYYMIYSLKGTALDVKINDTDAQTVPDTFLNMMLQLDWVFAFSVIIFLIYTLVQAFSIQTHPVYFVTGLVMSIILVFMSTIYVNVFEVLSATSVFATITPHFPLVTIIWSKLPLIMLAGCILIAIVMYAKPMASSGMNYAS